jgi:hypothetical protein
LKRVFFSLFLLLCLLVPGRATAQASPITWRVEVGFNGTYKTGAWIPITIDVANSGDDLRGRLEWRWSTTSARWSQDVDLPRGAQKRIILPVAADVSIGASAILQLVEGERVVHSERIRSTQIDWSRAVIGVVSASSNDLADVGGMYGNIASGAVLVRLDPAAFPDRGEFLQTFDILFLHDADTAAWSDAQRDALGSWVAQGGRVVAGGDRPETAAGLGNMEAATVGAARDVSLRALSDQTAFQPDDPDASTRVVQLTPTPNARVVVSSSDGVPLLVRRSFGSGQVLQTAFNLQTLSAAGDTVAMWEQLLPWSEHARQWSNLRGSGESLLRQGLKLSEQRLPSVWLIIGFLVLYIGLVGPANYLLLRRLDRREWAYLTIPFTVLIFTLGAYLIGVTGRGGRTTATGISVVRAVPGTERGHALNYMGVFSPARRSYRAEFPPDALVSNPFGIWNQNGNTLPVVRTESSVAIPDFLIDVGALRAVLVETVAPAPLVETSFRRDGNAIVIDVENRGTTTLEDLVVVVDQTLRQIDDLAVGERRSVRIEQQDMFMGVQLDDTDLVRRGSVVDSLRWSLTGQVNVALPDNVAIDPVLGGDGSARPPVSLLAWTDGAAQPTITLDGDAVEVVGETLFIWPVREVQP